MKFLSTIFYLCLIALMCTFVFLNQTKAPLNYHWGSVTWPVGVLVVIGFLVGGLLGRMMGSLTGRRAMKKKMLNKFSNASANQTPKVK